MLAVNSILLQVHIEQEKKRHELWAFLAEYGSGGDRYSHGYLQALEDIEEKLKRGKFDLTSE